MFTSTLGMRFTSALDVMSRAFLVMLSMLKVTRHVVSQNYLHGFLLSYFLKTWI
jgi:hypothetical protein